MMHKYDKRARDFLFLFYFGGVFSKRIITLSLVCYEMIAAISSLSIYRVLLNCGLQTVELLRSGTCGTYISFYFCALFAVVFLTYGGTFLSARMKKT